MRRGIVVSVAVLLTFCCLLSAAGGLAYLLWPRAVARPVVLIRSPRHGEQLEVGESVTVHSIARDEGKVARVEFWADGELRETQTSSLPGGTSPFPLLAQWQALSPGTHTLTVRAFNPQGGRAHASVNVEAFEMPDRDADGVADEADPCPDLAGRQAAGGCPDRDGDGIADYADACPDEAGLPQGEGCPVPSEGNGDGDGLLDFADACPDGAGSPLADGCPDADGDGVADIEDACPHQPGLAERDGCPVPGDLDADGIPDVEDDCPEEPGLPEQAGCRDGDGDGLRDADDACPAEPGRPEHDGCPDRDGDGVPDAKDLCLDYAGPPPSGCPDTGAGDRDGDGMADDVDLAPKEPGRPEHGGAPPPGQGEDADDNGIADDQELPATLLFDLAALGANLARGMTQMALRTVEVQALRFEVGREYDGVYCYVSLGHEPQRRFPDTGSFSAAPGVRQWDIEEYLGGDNSQRFVWDTDWPLAVDIWCRGYVGDEADISLGEIHEEHRHEDGEWNGEEITRRSTGGFEEQWFEVTYRICAPFCLDGAGLVGFAGPPQPIITHAAMGGTVGLVWEWEWDEGSIEEFRVYSRCGGAQDRMFLVPPVSRAIQINSLQPACEERCEFYVTAYGAGVESPRSNTAVWEGERCRRRMRVTFETLTTHELCCEDSPVGPVMGDLWANDQSLSFDAAHVEWAGRSRGIRLENNHEYSIGQEILRRIHALIDSCLEGRVWGVGCPGYWAPERNYVTVSLDPDEDLTLEVVVYDMDKIWLHFGWGNELEQACEARYTIPADQITPGRHTVHGIRCDLTVIIGDMEEW